MCNSPQSLYKFLIWRMNVTLANSPYRADQHSAPHVPPGNDLPPAPIDPSIDKWFFISVCSHVMAFLITGLCALSGCIGLMDKVLSGH